MAKVVQQDSQQLIIVEPWWAKDKSVYIGLGLGLIWWVLTALLRQYVVEPLACRDLSTATACVNAVGVSGAVATVLVAVGGMGLLIRYAQPRPVIIAVATAILLWDIGAIMNGLPWWAALLWAIFFYGASYGLFSMVARIRLLWLSLVVAIVIVVGVRLLLML